MSSTGVSAIADSDDESDTENESDVEENSHKVVDLVSLFQYRLVDFYLKDSMVAAWLGIWWCLSSPAGALWF